MTVYKPDMLFRHEFFAWRNMKGRCRHNSNYVDRGIKVCDRWLNGNGNQDGFECFLMDMGTRPSHIYTLERKKNDGNYEPDNCVWGTSKEQNRNRCNSRMVMFSGKLVNVSELAEQVGIDSKVVRARLDLGWDIGRALSTPVELRRT